MLVVSWVLYQLALAQGSHCDAAGFLVDLGSRRANLDEAKSAYLRARELAVKHGCAEAAARSAVGLAYVLLTERSYGEAEQIVANEMDRIRTLGSPTLLTEALLKRGAACDQQGRHEDAVEFWREAAEVSRTARYKAGYISAITNLGGAAYRAHRDDEASSYWLEVIDLSQRRNPLKVAELDMYLGIIAMRSGKVDNAQFRFAESRALYEKHGRRDLADKAASFLDLATRKV